MFPRMAQNKLDEIVSILDSYNMRNSGWFGTLIKLPVVLLIAVCLLTGCASSEVSRGAASGVDKTVANAEGIFDNASSSSPVDSYENASQTSKGAIIGAMAGALTGSVSTRIGLLSGTGIGAIVGATIGAYIDAHTTLTDRLQNRGVTLVTLGDQMLIVLPSARIFEGATGTIKSQGYSTLNMVAQYIRPYTKMMVKVAAYTNSLGPANIDLAVSREQARSVADYLETAGINSRIIYAEGYGGLHPVAPPAEHWDGGDNYRVEITLEKYDV